MNYTEIDYLLIGHITADIVPDGRTLGGTPSYSAATVKAMGLRPGVFTSAASGDPLLDELAKYSQVASIPANETTTFENIYEPTGRKQYLRALAAPIDLQDLPTVWKSVPLVHFAPMAGELDPSIVSHFSHATTLITLQGWLRRWGDDQLVRFKRWFDADVIRQIDIIVFSEEDILEAPELEAEIAAIARNLVVTRADKGGTHYHNGEVYHYPAIHVDVTHPTGAGDVFAGSLLCALHKLNGDMKEALRVASTLAGYSVTRVGLDSAPTPDEVKKAFQ